MYVRFVSFDMQQFVGEYRSRGAGCCDPIGVVLHQRRAAVLLFLRRILQQRVDAIERYEIYCCSM